MKVTKEICSFDELWEQSWSGALDTLKTIRNNGQEQSLMDYLEDLYDDNWDETTLNDYLWFERDEIFETLGIENE